MSLERFGSGSSWREGIGVEFVGSILGGGRERGWAKKPWHLHLLTGPEEGGLCFHTIYSCLYSLVLCLGVYLLFKH